MAGERFVDKAVTKVAAYVRANLQTYLTAVETAAGLAAGALEPPVEYLEANVPDDYRSPLLEIFDSAAQPEDAHGDKWLVDVVLAISFSGDASQTGNEKRMRRYATALKDCLRASPTLGGTVELCDLGAYSSEVVRGQSNATRYVFTHAVRVGVDD